MYGFAQSLQFGLQGVNIPPQLIQMLPYILTLTFLFYPEPKEAAYEISRIMGESITSDQIRGTFFEKIIDIFLKILLTFPSPSYIIVDVSLKETNESHAPLAQLVEQ